MLSYGGRACSLCHTLHQSSQQRHAILSSDGAKPIKRQQIKVLSSKEEENDKIRQTMSQTETVTQPITRPYHLPMPHAWSEKTLAQWAEINAQPLVDKIDQMLFTKWHVEWKLIWSVGMFFNSWSTVFENVCRVSISTYQITFKVSNTQVKFSYFFSRITPYDCKYNFPTCDLIKNTSHKWWWTKVVLSWGNQIYLDLLR